MQPQKPGRLELTLLMAGFTSLIFFILIVDVPQCNDEIPYLANVGLLHKYGLGDEYLVQLQGSAGPLHSLVHYLFEPITHLQPPGIRLVNVFFLAGIILFIGLILKNTGFAHWTYALYILAIPQMYALTGMAYTEMPALFFYALFLFCVLKAADQDRTFGNRIFYAFTAGTCFCLSILGRQPLLLTAAAIPLLFIRHWSGKSMLLLAIIFLTSLAVPCYVFLEWGGLMPPGDRVFYQHIPGQIGLRPDFFILCVFYIAVIFFILAPSLFAVTNKKEMILGIAGIIITGLLNFSFNLISYLPLGYVFKKMPSYLIHPAGLFFGWIFTVISLFFMYRLLQTALASRKNTQLIFFITSLILICAASLKITWGFSSRYSAQTAPLIILVASFYHIENRWRYLLMIVSIVIGLVSLYFFYGI